MIRYDTFRLLLQYNIQTGSKKHIASSTRHSLKRKDPETSSISSPVFLLFFWIFTGNKQMGKGRDRVIPGILNKFRPRTDGEK